MYGSYVELIVVGITVIICSLSMSHYCWTFSKLRFYVLLYSRRFLHMLVCWYWCSWLHSRPCYWRVYPHTSLGMCIANDFIHLGLELHLLFLYLTYWNYNRSKSLRVARFTPSMRVTTNILMNQPRNTWMLSKPSTRRVTLAPWWRTYIGQFYMGVSLGACGFLL